MYRSDSDVDINEKSDEPKPSHDDLEIDAVNRRDSEQRTPLHLAVLKGVSNNFE